MSSFATLHVSRIRCTKTHSCLCAGEDHLHISRVRTTGGRRWMHTRVLLYGTSQGWKPFSPSNVHRVRRTLSQDLSMWELKYSFEDPVGEIRITEDWSGEGNGIAGLQWLGGVVIR